MTDETHFPLLNPLEAMMRASLTGKTRRADVYAAVLDATLFVPSATEVGPNGVHSPMRIPMPGGEGREMIVAFTDRSRITAEARALAPFVFEVDGIRLVRNLPAETGLIIFAGPETAAMFDPPMLIEMRRQIYR